MPSMVRRFHFFSLRTAIRYHIAKTLMAKGWERIDQKTDAVLTDQHLTLNETISTHLEYKHLLAEIIKKHCPTVLPVTYRINDENYDQVIAEVIYNHYICQGQFLNNSNRKWILKPSLLNNAEQIKLFNHIEAVKKHYLTSNRLGGEHVLQEYIASPDLVEGKKYTFRMPVILTNFDGVYINRQGYVNISAFPFDPSEPFLNKKMHITNYVLDGELSLITQRSTHQLAEFSMVFEQMIHIVRKVIVGLLKEYPTYLKPEKMKRIEIFGFDFIMDANKKVWLLEVNQGPDAPMYEENELKPIIWEAFWQGIVEEFILPMLDNTLPHQRQEKFQQVLPQKEAYSVYREYVSRITKNF